MKQPNIENNFVYLFFSLLTFLFTAAITAEYPSDISEDVLTIITIIMLIVSIKSLRSDKTWEWVFIILSIVFVIFVGISQFYNHEVPIYILLVILLIFFVSALYVAGKQVLLVGNIDSNKIIGSISIYLLLGLTWATLYLLLLVTDVNAFSGIAVSTWQQAFSPVAYYSFVTLTTLGYGDILPTNHIAEFLVYIEAIVGVFYMAIIVASLISLRLNSLDRKE